MPVNEYSPGFGTKENPNNDTKMQALNEVTNQIKNDPELFRGYKDNIAMAFKDEYSRWYETAQDAPTNEDIHGIANRAAENFLNLWCSDPTPEK